MLGARGALSQTNDEVYDAERIDQRSRVIAVAIDARQQFYPQEDRYSYQPMLGRETELEFSEATWNKVIRDYNLQDLSI